jgi:hypothetical protein
VKPVKDAKLELSFAQTPPLLASLTTEWVLNIGTCEMGKSTTIVVFAFIIVFQSIHCLADNNLVINGALVLESDLIHSYDNVFFGNNSVIVTNGFKIDLTVTKNFTVNGKAEIRSFLDDWTIPAASRPCSWQVPPTPPAGADGARYCPGPNCDDGHLPPRETDGHAGGDGSRGINGTANMCVPPQLGSVNLRISGKATGSLSVKLNGVEGGQGGFGSNGGYGGAGQQGGRCQGFPHSPGKGGVGGFGGDGGDAGAGGNGGAGANFSLTIDQPSLDFHLSALQLDGGPPGKPGLAGLGRPGGSGGYIGRGGAGCVGVSDPPRPIELNQSGLEGTPGAIPPFSSFGAQGSATLSSTGPQPPVCQPTPALTSDEQFDAYIQLWTVLAPAIFNSSMTELNSADHITRYAIEIKDRDPTWSRLAFFLYLVALNPTAPYYVPSPDVNKCFMNGAIDTVYGREQNCCKSVVGGKQVGTPHRQCISRFGFEYYKGKNFRYDEPEKFYPIFYALDSAELIVIEMRKFLYAITVDEASISKLPKSQLFLHF